MSTITKLFCIAFWLRLDKMAHNRLNNQINRYACSLARKEHKHWASSVGEVLKYENNTPDLEPAPVCSNRLLYKVALIKRYEEEWLKDITHIIPLSHGPAKVGSTRVDSGFRSHGGNHYCVNLHVVKVSKMAYKVWSFGVSLFWLCCGCVEGAKYANGQYYLGKHQVECTFFGLLQHRRNSRIFTTICCVAHLPCSCEKEAFGSSLGIITGSNPLPKASKADISLSFYTLPRSAILTRFAPRLNRGQPYYKAGLTSLCNLG